MRIRIGIFDVLFLFFTKTLFRAFFVGFVFFGTVLAL